MISVVVVEDDEGLRMLLRRVLNDAGGFTVVGEADNGRDGITRVADLQPDLVMLDIKMPIMTGIEALPEIRRRSPESVVVVLSMFQDEELRQEALRLGAREYLDKGLESEVLVQRLREIMGESEGAVSGSTRRRGTAGPLSSAERRAPIKERSEKHHSPRAPKPGQ